MTNDSTVTDSKSPLTFVMVRTDGYETYGIKGFASATKAHNAACKLMTEVADWRGDKVRVYVDREGEHVLYINYVNGGYCQQWHPPEPVNSEYPQW